MRPLRPSIALLTLPLALALLLASCELAPVSDSGPIANVETIRAGTPSATSSPTMTITPTVTETSTATIGPSPTPTDTPLPTITPLPPTPTPNPAISGFSFCDQATAGASGRFSARLADVATSGFPAFEQLVLRFELGERSAPVQAAASCVRAADDPELLGDAAAPGEYLLRVDLPNWLRDERFSASPITSTLSFSNTRTITGVSFVAAPDADSGATLLIGLKEALPFKLSIERNPTRLVIAVARSSTLVSSSDSLRVPAGGAQPELAGPLFYLLDGDIWRVEGRSDANNVSDSPETETAFAVSQDGAQIAFCRAAPGLDPLDVELAVPSALWIMQSDGTNQRPLAQAGVNCADPAWSPDGATIAFSVDETGAIPAQRAIYSVAAAGGAPESLQETGDEWSRFAPQWLADGALIYAAEAQDGRSTLFLRKASGEVVDVGAAILVDDLFAARYSRFGRPLAARDGARVAVEALRSDSPGADLVILDADGSLVEVLGTQQLIPPTPTPTATAMPTATRTPRPSATAVSTPTGGTPEATAATTATPDGTPTSTVEATAALPTATLETEPEAEPVREGPFWSRPMAWNEQGQLLFLRTLCASSIVQDYQLYRWDAPQRTELLGTGQSLGGLGAAAVVGEGLAYVVSEQAPPGPRGPLAYAPRSASALWLWDLASGARSELLGAERGIGSLSQ